MKKLFALFALSIVLSAVLSATSARAGYDPAKADDDARAAMDDGTFAFCTSPPDPLPPADERACEMAREIPHCDALVARCTHAQQGVDMNVKPSDAERWSRSLGPVADVVTWILAIALALAVAVPLARLVAARLRDRELADDVPEAADEPKAHVEPTIETSDADRLLARAAALVRSGDMTAALIAYLEAALRALDRRGAIHLAPHRTNGEYVRGCTEADARPMLRDVVRTVDAVQFGGVAPTDEAVARVASKASAIVAAAVLALAMLVVGCGGAGKTGGPRGNDPLGDDLFRDVLRREHVELSSSGALASLRMDDARDAPPILLDAERVPLDERASKQLRDWIDAGGTLVLFGPQKALKTPLQVEIGAATTRDLDLVLPPRDTFEKGTDEDFSLELSDLEPFEAHGRVLRELSVQHDGGATLARIGAARYAVAFTQGKGRVVFVASDDLLTNIALARKGNAAVLVGILQATHADRLRLVRPEDGTSFADSPTTSLVRAGLGPALAQTVFAALILFLAVGVRATRPKPTPPPARRAFTEHVRATGALWARARIAPHALASYARWLEEQVRARVPRGMDAASWLAARAGADPASCAALWERATRARSADAPEGDELLVVRRLGVLYSSAVVSENARKRG